MNRKFTIILFLLIFFVGCGTFGKNFIKPQDDILLLGKTRFSQFKQQLGVPTSTGIKEINGMQIKYFDYSYADATENEGPLVEGVTPARHLTLFFMNDQLVGYEFISSFKKDHTDTHGF